LVTGTVDRRLVVLEDPRHEDWVVADLSGQPLRTRFWPAWTRQYLRIVDPTHWWSSAAFSAEGLRRLTSPSTLLVSLYHPEVFPLPRFPLSISDVAGALRANLSGTVTLMDMQLGVTLDDVLQEVGESRPDIVGISATFGQHDLMVELLDRLTALPEAPMLVAGGSLSARNERLLLDRYPQLLIARGAGEPTMVDLVAHCHGDLPLHGVRGLSTARPARGRPRCSSRVVGPQLARVGLPELDLLDATIAAGGVAQLESSRGCTSACSFCPRGHKGSWVGATPDQLAALLPAVSETLDHYPRASRTLYLVDEEFIGADPDAVERARSIAEVLYKHGFQWESSCRVDQVAAPSRSLAWHIERVQLWRDLVAHGLRRCLFGVESGVDTVLARFNKRTTARQNVLAVRTLSALGVPPRFTYLTFDPLMSLTELRATHAFQGRTDLLLRPQPHLSPAEIVRAVNDDRFAAEQSTGTPFYTGICYMLVSMECLTGSAYTRRIQETGLARRLRPSMGRIDAQYADWRIGRCSHHAQLWIDRHFVLDYTLKSLEKILDGSPRHAVRASRRVIKDAAFQVLGDMISLVEDQPLAPGTAGPGTAIAAFDQRLVTVLDHHLGQLRSTMATTVNGLVPHLPAVAAATIRREHDRWRTTASWHLINPEM
jgi:hypothetical protein